MDLKEDGKLHYTPGALLVLSHGTWQSLKVSVGMRDFLARATSAHGSEGLFLRDCDATEQEILRKHIQHLKRQAVKWTGFYFFSLLSLCIVGGQEGVRLCQFLL